MADFRYLIVGGGMTADAACRGIRDEDANGTIGLFAAEPHAPYARPPLSKGLWSGKDETSVWRGTDELGVDLHTGTRIVSLDLGAHTAADDRGETHGYERLLLATGGAPRRLPGGGDEGVVYFRTLDDYRALRASADAGGRIAVLGGGFIGSEIAAALAASGVAVTMVFPEDGIGARLFPPGLTSFLNAFYGEHGVDVVSGALVRSIEPHDAGSRLLTDTGLELDVRAVVAGLGIVPDTGLAERAGLPVDDGVLVDDYGLVEGQVDVFAAGDVARFPTAALGGTRRVEHEDHANTHGRLVGANMAGAHRPYDHLPFFYSDLFDLGYEAVGDVDARLATSEHWETPFRKGVVGYGDDAGRARGFLLWDTWGKVDAARELIRAGTTVDATVLGDLAA